MFLKNVFMADFMCIGTHVCPCVYRCDNLKSFLFIPQDCNTQVATEELFNVMLSANYKMIHPQESTCS